MAKSRWINHIVWCFVLAALSNCQCYARNADGTGPSHVLLLNSYHIGHRWSDEVTEGILEELGIQDNNMIELSVEYMDTMRFVEQNHLDMLEKLYRDKYNRLPISTTGKSPCSLRNSIISK